VAMCLVRAVSASAKANLLIPERGRKVWSRRVSPVAVCPQRRSLDRTDSSHSTVTAATALPAPHLPFEIPAGIGSIGWIADIRAGFLHRL